VYLDAGAVSRVLRFGREAHFSHGCWFVGVTECVLSQAGSQASKQASTHGVELRVDVGGSNSLESDEVGSCEEGLVPDSIVWVVPTAVAPSSGGVGGVVAVQSPVPPVCVSWYK